MGLPNQEAAAEVKKGEAEFVHDSGLSGEVKAKKETKTLKVNATDNINGCPGLNVYEEKTLEGAVVLVMATGDEVHVVDYEGDSWMHSAWVRIENPDGYMDATKLMEPSGCYLRHHKVDRAPTVSPTDIPDEHRQGPRQDLVCSPGTSFVALKDREHESGHDDQKVNDMEASALVPKGSKASPLIRLWVARMSEKEEQDWKNKLLVKPGLSLQTWVMGYARHPVYLGPYGCVMCFNVGSSRWSILSPDKIKPKNGAQKMQSQRKALTGRSLYRRNPKGQKCPFSPTDGWERHHGKPNAPTLVKNDA